MNTDCTVMCLNGTWKLALDPDNIGRAQGWYMDVHPEVADVPVPGCIQLVYPNYHGVVWYYRTFCGDLASIADHRMLLHFEDVDYYGDVWLNGQYLGSHEGAEAPFDLDATAAYRPGADNVLAVRVINVTTTPIDGLVLKNVPHRNRVEPYTNGSSQNLGGVVWHVELRRVPSVRIVDVFAMPDIHTGSFRVVATVRNDTGTTASGALEATIGSAFANTAISEATGRKMVVAEPGDSVYQTTLRLPQPRLWELDDPFLYRLTLNLETPFLDAPGGEPLRDAYSVRCGLRELRVERGFFRLNGRRILLKSTHTCNHFPLGQHVPILADHLRRDLLHAKEAGYNCVRYIAGVAWPEQLDLCDEIGLMVYEENQAAWCLEDSPRAARLYERAHNAMIRRDRNHACITAWGLLNETTDRPVFRTAVAYLPTLRELDPTRLVFLNSGRWDCQWSIGSISNPGGSEWEHTWSVEAPDAPPAPASWDLGYPSGYFERAGDAHAYPAVPQTAETDRFIRTLGEGTKPVLLSEYGIGSLMNVVRELRWCEQVRSQRAHAGQVVPDEPYHDEVLFREPADKLAADWQRLGFEGVYPVLEDFLHDSQRLHVRQRLLGFDLVRSNPQICGYNLTGMLDHGFTGEGVWSYWREWKPGALDALNDGWAPVRWCLFVNPLHGYVGRPFTVEVVLANEDHLPPGEYPVTVRISRQRDGILTEDASPGIVWERRLTVSVPRPAPGEDGPLAIPVLKDEVTLCGPAGTYELRAYLEQGGAPAGGRLAFRLSDNASLPTLDANVLQWGLEPRVQDWLAAHGVQCRPFSTRLRSAKPNVILVGEPPERERNPAHWCKLVTLIGGGSVVVFLSPEAFKRGEDATAWLPLANRGTCPEIWDWLYHKECVAKVHPVFAGLQAPGIMDWDYWGQVIPHRYYEGQDTPDETMAAAFAVCHWPAGYVGGTLLSAYRLGAGQMLLNVLRILPELDANPAADRLLLNLVAHAQAALGAPKTAPVREAELAEVLERLGRR